METSVDQTVKQIATRIRKEWQQRNRGIIDLAAVSSVKQIYHYRQKTRKTNNGEFVLKIFQLNEGYERQVQDLVAVIEPLFHSISPKFQGRFVQHLTSLIEEGLANGQIDSDDTADFEFVRFLLENLLVLEYKDAQIVARFTHRIDSILRSAGVPLIHMFESGLQERPARVLSRQCLILSFLLELKKDLLHKYGLGVSSSGWTKASSNGLMKGWERVIFSEKMVITDHEVNEQLRTVIFLKISLIRV